MNKRDVLKIKPGTWVAVKYDDVDHLVPVLVLRKPEKPEKGDMDVYVYDANVKMLDNIVHTQIVDILGDLEIPNLEAHQWLS